jgi:formylglycine-generating enzyme required for sulfatase activity
MTHIFAAAFMMGNPEGTGRPNERPQHMVTLSGYCIDNTEVTVAAYSACVANRGCVPAPTTNHVADKDDSYFARFNPFCNGDRSDRQDYPINCIDWDQAKAYCEWAGKRLPTEAEWEYAARGSDGRTYPWGEDPPAPHLLNACGSECVAQAQQLGLPGNWKKLFDGDDGWPSTAPVGSYPDGASPFGLLDMAGNVWEWNEDAYDRYNADAATNPIGSGSGAWRVFRGGGWYIDGANAARASARFWNHREMRRDDLGVRCVRDE